MADASRFADPAGESPGFLLWQVTLAWQRAIADALRPLDLTHVQFVLLACAWWLGHGEATAGPAAVGNAPSQLAVARQAGTEPKMTSEVLRKLEAKGLLTRAIDEGDTRVRRVRVTAAGARLAQRAVRTVEQADASFFGAQAGPLSTALRPLRALSARA